MKLCTALVLTVCVSNVVGWWDVGHQTVGAIAAQKMKNPKAIEQVNNILTYLDSIYNDEHTESDVGNHSATGSDRPELHSNTLASAGSWPDVSKSFYNMKIFDTWHYINQKYDPDGLDVNNTGCGTDSQVNAQTQAEAFNRDIPNIGKGRQTAHWYAHFGTAFLVHLVGDIHQPFHTMGRCIMYEGELSQDLGGNRWIIDFEGEDVNVHALWDSGAYRWDENKQAEIVGEDATYATYASELLDKHSVESLQEKGYDVDFDAVSDIENFSATFQSWIDESNEIAKEAYDRLPMGETVKQEDADWVYDTSEERVVLAGYRLAAYFDGLFAETDFPPLKKCNKIYSPSDDKPEKPEKANTASGHHNYGMHGPNGHILQPLINDRR
eukprot:Awhi_evm1s10322